MTISRNQLRAARVLLCLSQEELAALSHVGVATIRRYESGSGVSAHNAATLRATVEAAGAVILDDQEVGGRRIGDGVALLDKDDLPHNTLERLRAKLEVIPGRPPLPAGRPRKAKPPMKPSQDRQTKAVRRPKPPTSST